MDYEYVAGILGRGGVAAVEAALKDFAAHASAEEADAAVDLACRVIADETTRLEELAARREARIQALEAEAADLRRQIADALPPERPQDS